MSSADVGPYTLPRYDALFDLPSEWSIKYLEKRDRDELSKWGVDVEFEKSKIEKENRRAVYYKEFGQPTRLAYVSVKKIDNAVRSTGIGNVGLERCKTTEERIISRNAEWLKIWVQRIKEKPPEKPAKKGIGERIGHFLQRFSFSRRTSSEPLENPRAISRLF